MRRCELRLDALTILFVFDKDIERTRIRVGKKHLRKSHQRNYLKRILRHFLRMENVNKLYKGRVKAVVVLRCDWNLLRTTSIPAIWRRMNLYLWRDLNPHL